MREWNKPATTLLLAFSLGTFCLYFYLSHLSFNYTFDGLAFSSQVEKPNEPLWLFFHPHHLLYTFMAKLFFLWGREHGATWDGLVALQFLDILTGVLGSLIAFHLLVRETNDRLIAVLCAVGMAFSHSYWYFSTIPGVRIFATVTPLFTWYVLTYLKKSPPYFGWVVGFAHVLAVLGHQTNLLLVPAFLGGIWCLRNKSFWDRLKASVYYLLALTSGVLFAYGLVGRYIYQRKNFHDWLWWVFSYFHSPQNWGGHFKPSGFASGESAMVRAFLPAISPIKPVGDNLTFGACETILQYTILVLLALLLLRIRHHWTHHRQLLWISFLWVIAFVPFFIWWEPWNIEFWVSSTVPCWILMGIVVTDLAQQWKSPILQFATRGTTIGVWASLITLLFFSNIEGSVARTMANHYDFKVLLGALDWKIRSGDILVLDGENNVHYYVDRFQKREYLSLYSFLKKYGLPEKEEVINKQKKKLEKSSKPKPDPWTDLSTEFEGTWSHHHKVWVLTEAVNNFDGGRQLLEETLKLPDGTIKDFFRRYELQPVPYHGNTYFYEVIQPAHTASAPTSMNNPKNGEKKEPQ